MNSSTKTCRRKKGEIEDRDEPNSRWPPGTAKVESPLGTRRRPISTDLPLNRNTATPTVGCGAGVGVGVGDGADGGGGFSM